MRSLSHVTSPPALSVRMTAFPSSRWALTDKVRPDVRYTISADAVDANAQTSTPAAIPNRTAELTCMNERSYHPRGRGVQKGYSRAWRILMASTTPTALFHVQICV